MKNYSFGTIGIVGLLSGIFGFYLGLFLENAGFFDWVNGRVSYFHEWSTAILQFFQYLRV